MKMLGCDIYSTVLYSITVWHPLSLIVMRIMCTQIASVDKYVGSINAQLQQHHELEKLEAILNKIEPYDAVECPNDSECVKVWLLCYKFRMKHTM